jgi:hypothetical protein
MSCLSFVADFENPLFEAFDKNAPDCKQTDSTPISSRAQGVRQEGFSSDTTFCDTSWVPPVRTPVWKLSATVMVLAPLSPPIA